MTGDSGADGIDDERATGVLRERWEFLATAEFDEERSEGDRWSPVSRSG